ncbi:MAG TPA: YbaK/EbsC family protein [Burkholderiales bacterium]|jgi:prolyl-tRNA editing enzyme YbaK/EbsC (Cys-tRNA(Pro) deacylase)
MNPKEAAVRANPSVQRVAAALEGSGARIVVTEEAAHSAAQAAQVLGCELGQIAKSIIFRSKETDRVVLVVTSGANRVDEKRVMEAIGEKIGRADADFVKQRTGFSIGGVSPLGHLTPAITLMDEALMAYAEVYPAAGHPNTMFRIAPAQLAQLAQAKVCTVA